MIDERKTNIVKKLIRVVEVGFTDKDGGSRQHKVVLEGGRSSHEETMSKDVGIMNSKGVDLAVLGGVEVASFVGKSGISIEPLVTIKDSDNGFAVLGLGDDSELSVLGETVETLELFDTVLEEFDVVLTQG